MVILNLMSSILYLLAVVSTTFVSHVEAAPTSQRSEQTQRAESGSNRKVVAPKYMRDLYNMFVDGHGRSRAGVTSRADKIRCFLSDPSQNFHQKPELSFDVRDIGMGERIVRAELQLFKPRPHLGADHRAFVQVEIMDTTGEREAVRILNSYGGGWKSFDMTEAVKGWQRRASTRNIIRVKITGQALDNFFVHQGKTTERLPFLVVFSQSMSSNQQPQQPQQAASSAFLSSVSATKHRRGPRNKRGSNGHSCKRKSMIVDTAEIGWQNYILAPTTFDAYRCEGKCRAYASQAVKTQTNHAIVQAILSQLGPRHNRPLIRPPCCAPSQFESKKLLLHRFVHGQSVVGLEEFNDMVVKSCACL